MKDRVPAVAAAALLWLCACSVKEPRELCPCIVEVDLSAFSERAHRLSVDLGGLHLERDFQEGDSLLLVLRRPRLGLVPLTVWAGGEKMQLRGRTLTVGALGGCDSVFVENVVLDTDGEICRVRPIPRKQFANVWLQLIPEEEDPPGISYRIRSDCNGIILDSSKPASGPLELPLDSEGPRFLFRLPRQSEDAALVLESLLPDGSVQSYPLGNWILEAGYDWNARDLDDIAVGMDLYDGSFTVSVLPWSEGKNITETI
ncbi:MAG: hypothetical protein J6T89_05295 [Bacteroidales bacterium]|nr:hypothetical protein [Bacteroidales bacterium]